MKTMFASPLLTKLSVALIFGLMLFGCSRGGSPESSAELAVQGLYSATISDNAEYTLIGSINHGASLWQRTSEERQYNWNHKTGEFSEITAVAFTPSGDYAITTTPQTMVLWNRASGEGLSYWNAPSEILDVELLPTGRYALLGLVDHTATLFDVRNGGAQRVYHHEGRVNSVDSHVPTNRILTGSDDFSAILWDLTSAKPVHVWQLDEEVQLVRLSSDGKRAFAMAKYSSARVYDTQSGEMIGEIPLGQSAIRRGTELTAAKFSDDGSYLITGNANRLVQLWQLSDMKEIARWQTPRRNKVSPTGAAVLDLAFLGEQSYYAITSDGFGHELSR